MVSFRQVITDQDIDISADIIRKSFATVAAEFGITQERVPSNPAFITSATLKKQITPERFFYLLMHSNTDVGTVAIERSANEPGMYFIEKVAILPEWRHQNLGKELMRFAEDQIMKAGGSIASVAIIFENTRLKNWYEQQRYVEIKRKSFDHLPFTVSFLQKRLG